VTEGHDVQGAKRTGVKFLGRG